MDDVVNGAGRIESINVSRGGVPKMPVFEALVTVGGIDGDRQRDPRFHGGPERAVVLFSLDVIRALQREGHPIAIGTAGENLTISGIEWRAVIPGTAIAIGDVRLHITKYASPATRSPPRSPAATRRASPRMRIQAGAASARAWRAKGSSGSE